MNEFGVKNIVFSSSSTVYGDPEYLPIDENHPVGNCTNPYGRTKYFMEEMMRDLCKADQVTLGKVRLILRKAWEKGEGKKEKQEMR